MSLMRTTRLHTEAAAEHSLSSLIRTSEVIRASIALIIVQLGFRAWATYRGWFHIDDFNFVSNMREHGPSLSAAFDSYFGHVMPGAMYLSWFNDVLAPWQWWLPATELVVAQAAADVGLLLLLVRLFGVRRGILPPLALYLFSVISLPGTVWWAAAVNLLPLTIALFYGLLAHHSYLRSGRTRHAVAANAVTVLGLAFNEKTLLVYLAVGVFTLCYYASGGLLARAQIAWRLYRPAILLYSATILLYVVLYASIGRGFGYGERRGLPVLGVLENMVLRSYLPGLVGGPLYWWHAPDEPGSVPLPGDLLVVASVVAVGLILRELRRTRTMWARALWMPALFLLVDVALVTTARASYVGAPISLDYRYQGELAAITAVALACAVMPVRGAKEGVRVTSSSELLDHPSRVLMASAAAAILALFSSVTYLGHWHQDTKSRDFVQRLTTELDARHQAVPIVDGPVPASITNGYRYPENLISHVFGNLSDKLRYPTVSTDTLYMIDDSGAIVPAEVPAARSALPRSGSCGYRITDRSERIKLDGPVVYGGWWIRIGYIASNDSPVEVTAGGRTVRSTVRPGVHALYVAAGARRFDVITIAGLSPGTTMCTNDITVGRPEPHQAEEP
ncbi:MAG TPA: hypothetical protein VHO29_01900 [Marmoricola sp.]|nr:hypothetical protein [Marmoricola sp.]